MKSVYFARKTKWFAFLVLFSFLAVFYQGSTSVVYASSDAHVSEDRSIGGEEHRDSGHSAGEKVQHDTGHSAEKSKEVGFIMAVNNVLPFVVVMIPLIAVFLLILAGEEGSLKLTAYSTLAAFLFNIPMIPSIWAGNTLNLVLELGVHNISLAFFADTLSLLVGLVASFVWMLASFYTIEYMSHHGKNLRRYCAFSLLSLTGMLGVVYTRNLFALYIFFEMLSVCSYVMVVHEETEEAKKAGLKYLSMGITGGLIMFMAIVMTYKVAGTADLAEISKMGLGIGHHPWMPYIFLGLIIGFAAKAGMFPLHIWLPAAHPVAPAPASALLSGVMIKAGGYGIIRTIYTIVGVDVMRNHSLLLMIFIFAVINIFLGSAMAIRSKEIKLMLAYSSIAQIGYVILGATLLTPYGIVGGAIHIFNHAIIKGTLFLCAGAFIHQTGLRQLEDLKGIGKRMPITTACFTIAGFSMIGFPPFNGFVTKWFLALGTLQHTSWVGPFALGMLLLSSLMNVLYYGPVIYGAWFMEGPSPVPQSLGAHAAGKNDDPGLYMIVPLIILGVCVVFFGMFPHLPVSLATEFSHMVFP